MPAEKQSRAGNSETSYPLSPLQQGMLFNTLLDPESGAHIGQLSCRLEEALDIPALQRAWRCVVARHPVLCTNLHWKDLAEPQQEVHTRLELPWEEQDRRGIAGSGQDEYIAGFLNEDRRRGFDLTRAPLFRLTLLRHGEASFHLIWTIHHTVLDDWSITLIAREVFTLYEAFRQGREISLPPLRPYRDYIDWLQQQNFSKDEAFWRQTLGGFTAPTPLVVDHVPNTRQSSGTLRGTREILLSAETTSVLRTLAHENEFTLNTFIQGAWALLLNRYSGESDVVFGVVRANRRFTIDGAEAMTGLFVNTLPLRVPVNPEAALVPWLKEVRLQWLAMCPHQHAPISSPTACKNTGLALTYP